jgi:DNA-binding transcriptional ArsR family regulator
LAIVTPSTLISVIAEFDHSRNREVKGYARPIADVQQLIKALSSPIRREILWLVRDHELPAGEIATAFEVTAPTVSEHLAVLRAAGLVEMRVDGSFRRYRTNRAALDALGPDVLGRGGKWSVADDIPETRHASGRHSLAVTVEVELEADVETAYGAFVDPVLFSRWLGVPVALEEGRFSTTLEWGTSIRGHYEVAVPPSLLALRWDFEDDDLPVPGSELVSYVRFHADGAGCRVVVHQLAADREQADFLEVAWALVLGRLREGLPDAIAPADPPRRRASRPKRRSG